MTANRLLAPALALSLALAAVVPAMAETTAPAAEAAADEEMDALFAALAAAPDEATAQAIEDRIWRNWIVAPDDRAQELLDGAFERRRWLDYQTALKLLDELVRDYPAFAEGWNQRATVRFLSGDLDGSLADIAETLKREPRHFGALAGKVLVLTQKGDYDGAQRALRKALRIHPWIPERGLLDPSWREQKI